MQKWMMLRIACAGLCCMASITLVQAIDDDYGDRMRFADGLFARQMYDLALREYAAILRTFPAGEQNDAATFRLAESLRLSGDVDTAGRFYGRVASQYRESPYRLRAAYRRARLYADDGDLASARAHFGAILAASPEPDLAAATRYHLGDVLYRQEALEEADTTLRELLEEHPDSEFVVFALLKRAEIRRMWLAAAHGVTGDLDENLLREILGFYEQALAAADTDRLIAEVLFQKADIHFRREAFEEAAALYRRMLREFPADVRTREARLQAAWSALRSNLYAESLAVAQQALADGSAEDMQAEWLYVLANSQRQLLQTEQAAATYGELLSRFPQSRFANASRYETAVAYFQAGHFREAIREAEQIQLVADVRKDVNWLLAESYAALQQPAEAVQHYRFVVREGGTTDRVRDALYRLGHQLQQQGSYREASSYYLQLVDTFPASSLAPQALFASGFALAQAQAHEEAVRDWRRLVQAYSDHPLVEEALYQKAMGEIRVRRRSDALMTLSELQRLFPESRYRADSYYWQGMLHFEAERFAEAESTFRQALALASRVALRRDAQFQLGLVLQRLDKADESARLLDALVDSPLRDQFPAPLLEWLAGYHGEQASYAQMAQVAQLLAKQVDPAWQQAGHVLLARARMAEMAESEAEKALRAALELDVKTAYAGEAALQLGLLLLERGELDAADRNLRRVAELAVGREADAVRTRSLMGLGKVALAQERPDEAARRFLSVGILYDDPVLVPESLYLAATSFDAQGRAADVAKVVSEMGTRYPESEWTRKAREAWGE